MQFHKISLVCLFILGKSVSTIVHTGNGTAQKALRHGDAAPALHQPLHLPAHNTTNHTIHNTTSVNSTISMIQQREHEFDMGGKEEPINKVVLAVVVALNFGFCGVDRCLFGQVAFGLMKGFTCGGFFIWYIIDWFVLALNILQSKDSINTFGFEGTFEPGSVQNALYIFVGLWIATIIKYAILSRHAPEAPKAEARSAIRRSSFAPSLVGPPSLHEIQVIFKKFDKDDNGTLDQDEFQAALTYLGVTDQDSREIAKTLVDTNHDGLIDIREFAEAFETRVLQAPSIQPRESMMGA